MIWQQVWQKLKYIRAKLVMTMKTNTGRAHVILQHGQTPSSAKWTPFFIFKKTQNVHSKSIFSLTTNV
jgi:hypothetical protein